MKFLFLVTIIIFVSGCNTPEKDCDKLSWVNHDTVYTNTNTVRRWHKNYCLAKGIDLDKL